MIVRLTSAAILHGVTEAIAAHMIDHNESLPDGYWVDFYNHRAYLWKDDELVADATL